MQLKEYLKEFRVDFLSTPLYSRNISFNFQFLIYAHFKPYILLLVYEDIIFKLGLLFRPQILITANQF